jgi:epoxide hydrolase 4
MIQLFQQPLPHNITLSCRATGVRGRPVLMFLHGFPEAAFVWDELMEHFAKEENGGYRCIAPNLRGFEKSSDPAEVRAYRPKFLTQDIAALIAIETNHSTDKNSNQLECLVAHDWGGAVAWNLMNQQPHLAKKLAIINSPHPGTFLRELKNNPKQQAASAYMNFLIRPDAEKILLEEDCRRLFEFFTNMGAHADKNKNHFGWLTESVKQQYRDVWNSSLTGGCNYYRASPLRPPSAIDKAAAAIDLPRSMLTIDIPTMVVWAMDDIALPPELLVGLDDYIAQLTVHKINHATHWIVHEQPQLVAGYLKSFLL